MLKNQIKNILKEKNIKINKVLGQNFLIDQRVVQDMVLAADLKESDTVLEVGPGLGILTEAIAKKKCRVIAIEKDKNFVSYLKKKFKNNKNIKIIDGDILKITDNVGSVSKEKELSPEASGLSSWSTSESGFCCASNYKIIANLPFYLTSRFLRVFLESKNKPKVMVLLMQKEVAERIIAQENNASVLSVACALYSNAKITRQVSRKSFYPKPDVDCAVVKFEIFKKPKYKIKDINLFFKVVKTGFSARRKQIHNNISSGFLISSEEAKDILKKTKIDPTRRAQTLSLEEWVELYEVLGNR